ncbi:MAG: ribonuclease E/G [Pseudomonadota bacterium]
MTKKMLIDAAHPEEVRVAVLSQNKIEDFDFESASKRPLRGNIFLARVTRVEPSLQAAFVDYGGNRHGFLAFSEIHPDYYQIPVSDRKALQEAEREVAALAAELELAQRGDDEEDDADAADAGRDEATDDGAKAASSDDDDVGEEEDADDDADTAGRAKVEEEEEEEEKDEAADEDNDNDASEDGLSGADKKSADKDQNADDAPVEASVEASDDGEDEDLGDDDADADEDSAADANAEKAGAKTKKADSREALFERYKDAKRKRSSLLRNYKIQEVIKRRQILLVQVVKEERGTKGAALTTYLSLAGRYCVLMPNTARGGGISRKIANGSDRRRLRRVVDSLDVPQGMGLIIRTAGSKRTKTEIKRDYDYLLRMWENIRSLTLKSIAPCQIYEEASLIKRAIRDLYDKDISKVLVEGEAGYREAKDFMKLLMPSHAKHVQPYKDRAPIFLKHGVEAQLDGMYQPTVRLKSGGYIVIHQTEALVAIDVNSGRATRERNIEQTALKTNVEAAEEAARQFRLRDLAGLIVLDFIDMEEPRNNRKVEKALKEALKSDRARLQVGRISPFGLLEMSRQRRRSGIVDGTTQACPTCSGAGVIRSHDIAALRILRAVEGEAISGKVGLICVRTSIDVALHVLNHNREWIQRIEVNNGVQIELVADPAKHGDEYDLEKSGAPRDVADDRQVVTASQSETLAEDSDEDGAQSSDDDADARADDGEEKSGGRKRRRRRRSRRDKDTGETEAKDQDESPAEQDASADGDGSSDDKPRKRRRRGRRGGRRNRRDNDVEQKDADKDSAGDKDEAADKAAESSPVADKDGGADRDDASDNAPASESAPKTMPEGQPKAVAEPVSASADDSETPAHHVNGAAELAEQTPEIETETLAAEPAAAADGNADDASPEKKKARRGWWSRA